MLSRGCADNHPFLAGLWFINHSIDCSEPLSRVWATYHSLHLATSRQCDRFYLEIGSIYDNKHARPTNVDETDARDKRC